MAKEGQRQRRWERRKKRVRKQLARSTRPLLTMYRSDRHIYAQIDAPISGRTVAGVSTLSPSVRAGLTSTKSRAAAAKVGIEIARLAREHQRVRAGIVEQHRHGLAVQGHLAGDGRAPRAAGQALPPAHLVYRTVAAVDFVARKQLQAVGGGRGQAPTHTGRVCHR